MVARPSLSTRGSSQHPLRSSFRRGRLVYILESGCDNNIKILL